MIPTRKTTGPTVLSLTQPKAGNKQLSVDTRDNQLALILKINGYFCCTRTFTLVNFVRLSNSTFLQRSSPTPTSLASVAETFSLLFSQSRRFAYEKVYRGAASCAKVPSVSAAQIIGLIIALLIMAIGVAGSILPGVPSTPLVLLSAIAHKLYFGDAGAGWIVISLLVAFTALSLVMDYAASIYGAKRLGATWRGATGAMVGGLIGLFFNLPGILLGPFLGALVFEMAGGRKFKE